MHICRSKMLAALFLGLLLPLPSFGEEANPAGDGRAQAANESLKELLDRIEVNGLIEFGGGYKSNRRHDGGRESQSDLHLTTAEFGIALAIHDWIRAETVFLYEDPFDAEESGISLDAGFVTLGNTEKFPLYVSVGKLYVPFGILLSHLPDNPAVDQPMTLRLGETSAKAVVLGMEHSGLSLSGYVFNGNAQRVNRNSGAAYGFDGHYQALPNSAIGLLLGASYISNIANANCLTETVCPDINLQGGNVGGMAAYLHLGFHGSFFHGEYLTALDAFCTEVLSQANGRGAQPAAWNIEAGYNWKRKRNLEMVFKYAGSSESEALGFARKRFGFGFNQEISRNVTASFAYLRDKYHSGDSSGRDRGYTVLGQIAVRF